MAESYLDDYIAQAWHILEPTTVFIPNWHIDAICDHLTNIFEIRNLIINIPPGTMKSLTVSVFWPSWLWIREPSVRFLFSSYAQDLSLRDSVRCRRLIESMWYQERWGNRFRLVSDQNQKGRFENDKTGNRLATSVGGANTGERGDIIVVDDPNNVKEAESVAKRTDCNAWWDEVMSTRINDRCRYGRVIIQQRTHEDDLTGHILEKDLGYTTLVLPMEYEKQEIYPGMTLP
jgi:hypothetical protein